MTALSFVWVHPYSQNSRCDITILSMSDCLGMCLQIIDNGVSIGTSAWGICVYSDILCVMI